MSQHSSVRGLSAADYAIARAAALRHVNPPPVTAPQVAATDQTPEEFAASKPRHVGTMSQAEYNAARSIATRRK